MCRERRVQPFLLGTNSISCRVLIRAFPFLDIFVLLLLQWNLLEHAFDTILEAGEIPHPSFFTEMVCQSTVQDNYERAVQILNAIAHAPFQISENQWTDLFEENRERINNTSLERLLNVLNERVLSIEPSVLNLIELTAISL